MGSNRNAIRGGRGCTAVGTQRRTAWAAITDGRIEGV